MNKTTKGAIAAAASATLLLGGAGTLAYWSTAGTVTGGSFTTGALELDTTECDTARWTVSNTIEGVSDVAVPDPASFKAVPGDVLTKACDIDIIAEGDNLRALLEVVDGDANAVAGDAENLDDDDYEVSGTFTLAGDTVTEITDEDAADPLSVLITVAFPIGDAVDNGSQRDTLTIDDFSVTATQVQS